MVLNKASPGCILSTRCTVYPKKYAHGFCFAVLCCGYTLTDFPMSIRLTSLALWQSNNCPSASKAILMNMDKNFMWVYYERLHNHNKAKHNKTVCIFLGIYCSHCNNHNFAPPNVDEDLKGYFRMQIGKIYTGNQVIKNERLKYIQRIRHTTGICCVRPWCDTDHSPKYLLLLRWC